MFAIFPGKWPCSEVTDVGAHSTIEVFTGIYGFSIGTGGLAYIGLGVGFFLATLFGAYFADQVYAHVCQAPIISLVLVADIRLFDHAVGEKE